MRNHLREENPARPISVSFVVLQSLSSLASSHLVGLQFVILVMVESRDAHYSPLQVRLLTQSQSRDTREPQNHC